MGWVVSGHTKRTLGQLRRKHAHAHTRVQQYLTDLFADYSTCLILAFTVERGLAVFYPQGSMNTAICDTYLLTYFGLQCFDAVGWAAGRASGL